jgi:hypothetical protein
MLAIWSRSNAIDFLFFLDSFGFNSDNSTEGTSSSSLSKHSTKAEIAQQPSDQKQKNAITQNLLSEWDEDDLLLLAVADELIPNNEPQSNATTNTNTSTNI